MPVICLPLNGQRIDIVKKQFPFLKELDLGDNGKGDSEIDMLIGEDFYWNIVAVEIKHCGNSDPIAVRSKLGWLLRGPFKAEKI